MTLSEKEIREQAIQFLREYYRYRDRNPEGFFEARTNQVTSSGIIADGMITFKKVDGAVFVASVEATSINKEEEIRFRRLNRLLTIDAFTAAFLLTAFMLSFLYFGHFLVSFYGDYYAYGSLVLLTFFCFFIISWVLLSKFRRYRYIYAIEQFRQYAVDEQWIAFDDSIFPNYGNKYLEELKKQCYKWGIGLLQMRNTSVYPLITPSRVGAFGKRKKTTFFKSGTIVPKLSTGSFGKQIMKYRKGAFNQFFLIFAALLVFSFITFRFYKESPFSYWTTEQMYKHAELVDQIGAEELSSWVEPDYIIPFRKKVQPYLDKRVTIFVQQEVAKTTPKAEPKVFVLTDKKIINKNQLMPDGLSCKGIPGSSGDDYIIQLGAYQNKTHAKNRIIALNRAGITAELFSCGCLGSKARLNCVLYVHAYASADEAILKMKDFEQKMRRYKISVEELWLRPMRVL